MRQSAFQLGETGAETESQYLYKCRPLSGKGTTKPFFSFMNACICNKVKNNFNPFLFMQMYLQKHLEKEHKNEKEGERSIAGRE